MPAWQQLACGLVPIRTCHFEVLAVTFDPSDTSVLDRRRSLSDDLYSDSCTEPGFCLRFPATQAMTRGTSTAFTSSRPSRSGIFSSNANCRCVSCNLIINASKPRGLAPSIRRNSSFLVQINLFSKKISSLVLVTINKRDPSLHLSTIFCGAEGILSHNFFCHYALLCLIILESVQVEYGSFDSICKGLLPGW